MAQSDENTLQDMYEYKKLTSSIEENEYVVRGATLECDYGEHLGVLNLESAHNVFTSDNRPLINVWDCGITNVQGFGQCRLMGEECSPNLKSWKYDYVNIEKVMLVDGGFAVFKGAHATCYEPTDGEGWVSIITSGQVSPDYSGQSNYNAVDIKEDEYGSWTRQSEYGKDFLGHVKVDHAGVYNFGIKCTSQDYSGGSVFLYKKNTNQSSLTYLGAYLILEHKNEKKYGFKNGITNWINVVLDSTWDYYVEIDCPGIQEFNYMLIGNQDKNELVANRNKAVLNTISAIWTLDLKLGTKYNNVYKQFIKENKTKIPLAIMYLEPWYEGIVKDILEKHASDDKPKISNDTASTVLSLIALAAGPTPAGTVASICALVISFLSEKKIEKLCHELLNNNTIPVKVFIYDTTDERTMYGTQGDPLVTYDYEVLSFNEYIKSGITEIYGEKYLIGSFNLLHGFTSDIPKEVVENEVSNALITIFEKLNGK